FTQIRIPKSEFLNLLSHFLRSDHHETTASRSAPALEIHAANDFFVPWRELLLDGQFVGFDNGAAVVHIRGLKLDLVIGEAVAVVSEPDDPGGPGAGRF